eukprot:gene15045-17799_t
MEAIDIDHYDAKESDDEFGYGRKIRRTELSTEEAKKYTAELEKLLVSGRADDVVAMWKREEENREHIMKLAFEFLSMENALKLRDVLGKQVVDNQVMNSVELRLRYQRQQEYMDCVEQGVLVPAPRPGYLIDVFEADGSSSGIFVKEKVDQSEREHDYYEDHNQRYNRVIIPSLPMYKLVLDVYSNYTLANIKWRAADGQSRILVAGGSVSSCLLPLPANMLQMYAARLAAQRAIRHLPKYVRMLIMHQVDKDGFVPAIAAKYSKDSFAASDIDLFIVGRTLKAAQERAFLLVDEITAPMAKDDYRIVRTDLSITILCTYPTRPIQIITKVVRDEEDLLLFFDMDSACFAYDGQMVRTLPRGVRAFNRCINLVGPRAWVGSSFRYVKYQDRGFNPLCFEVCKHIPRCDVVLDYSNESDDDSFYKANQALPYGPNVTMDEADQILAESDDWTVIDRDQLENELNVAWKFARDLRKRKMTSICYQCGVTVDWEDRASTDEWRICMCNDCRSVNEKHWTVWDKVDVNQQGLIALVTGGRIKIGFQCAIRLLRSGYRVIVTTRFPQSAAAVYNALPDADEWRDRLDIYGIDFRHLPSVSTFIEHVKKTYPRLDILINNAAQTIRRPRAYYHSLITQEQTLSLSNLVKSIGSNPSSPSLTDSSSQLVKIQDMSSSTMAVLLPEDQATRDDKLFPVGQVDEHGEQLDLRRETSWVAPIEAISPVEMMEVQIINSTIPFMLISQLEPMMSGRRELSAIVNVTSPEGSMRRSEESGLHIHTNMAKASLNMLSKSLGDKFTGKNIYICSVDPGWSTTMQPTTPSKVIKEAPLSDQDGAARVLHPVHDMVHLANNTPHLGGVLFQNYKVVSW